MSEPKEKPDPIPKRAAKKKTQPTADLSGIRLHSTAAELFGLVRPDSNTGRPDAQTSEPPSAHTAILPDTQTAERSDSLAPTLPNSPAPESPNAQSPIHPRRRAPGNPRASTPEQPATQAPELDARKPGTLDAQTSTPSAISQALDVPAYVAQEQLYPSRIHRRPLNVRLPSEKVIYYKQEALRRGLDAQDLVEMACDDWLARNPFGGTGRADAQTPTPPRIQTPHDEDEEGEVANVSNPLHHLTRIQHLYTELTGMPWTHKDTRDYRTIAPLVGDRMEEMMRQIRDDANEPVIYHFAFFVIGMRKKLIAAQVKPGKNVLRQRYRALAKEAVSVNVGRELQPSDWVADLKRRVARDGLAWNNDLANEVLGL